MLTTNHEKDDTTSMVEQGNESRAETPTLLPPDMPPKQLLQIH